MSVGWNGATPVSFADAASYDLGTKYHANADITITDIRIFGGNTGTMGGRTAHLFSAAGGVLATINLPNSITPGWATYALTVPVDVNVGTDFWVAYDTIGSYGLANPGGFPVVSADGLVTATGSAFTLTPGQFPSTSSTFFFGVDIQYMARGGNVRPVAGLTVTASGPLQAQAVVTITDETPATCSIVVEWGDGLTSSGSGPQTVSHTYAAAGTYAVMVTVTDSGGLTDSAAAWVTVLPSAGSGQIAAIMVGIQTRLATIAGLRTDAITPESTNAPFAFVGVPRKIDYHVTQGVPRGKVALFFVVTLGVTSVVDRVGQGQLADYADPSGVVSIKAAIEADRTLGGLVDSCYVLEFQRVDAVQVIGDPETRYYGGEFTVQVVATPT